MVARNLLLAASLAVCASLVSKASAAPGASSAEGVDAGRGRDEERFVPASLPNGMLMRLPSNVLGNELGYALELAGNDMQTFASTAASLSSNPALASAAHSQANLKRAISSKIASLESNVVQRQAVVSAALYELQRAARTLSLAQRDAFIARSALASAHRQLAALDVNSRRLADAARLADLQRALSLTSSSLAPGSVITATQRVVNAQMAASLKDQIARTEARIAAATHQIETILAANVTAVAAEEYRVAEKHEQAAASEWTAAQKSRSEADRANTVRAHVLASAAHKAINQAGIDASSGAVTTAAPAHPAAAPAAAPAAHAAAKPAFKEQSLGASTTTSTSSTTSNAAHLARFASADMEVDAEEASAGAAAASTEKSSTGSTHGTGNSGSLASHANAQHNVDIGAGAGGAAAAALTAGSQVGSELGLGSSSGASAALRGGSELASKASTGALRRNNRAAAFASTGANAQQRRMVSTSTAEMEAQSAAAAAAAVQARVEAALAQTEKISRDTRLHRDAMEDGEEEA